MNGKRKFLWVVPWVLLIFAAPGWGVEIGEPMPGFSIRTFDGGLVAATDLKGSPALLVFWNTWCPNCMREIPKIDRLAKKFVPRGMKFLAINTGYNDSESKARAYWQKHDFGYHSGFDHGFDIGQSFGIRGVPTIFLVDAKGIVRYKQAALPEDMEERLEQFSHE